MDIQRQSARKELKEQGIEPYPYFYHRTHYTTEVIDSFSSLEGKEAAVAGRIMTKRSFGNLLFATLQDVQGKIQVMVRKDHVGKEALAAFEKLDTGDIIGVRGIITKTKKGEISVDVKTYELLCKSLRVLPEKWHGLENTEIRYRKRYLDLIANPDQAEIFKKRALLIQTIRDYLNENHFLEVETPILQPLYGGAAAKPFQTRHNALETDLYLRIADELYLKRLIAGGLERVYEISKDFRNEDIDSAHNPEFTMLEFYEAYTDYQGMMKRAEEIFQKICNALYGKIFFEYQDKKVSFKGPFTRVSIVKVIQEKSGIDVLKWHSDSEAMAAAKKLKMEVSQSTRAHVFDALFDKYVKPSIWNPTFVIDYPEYMCPLTKKKRGEPRLAERYELYIAGEECANAYSELTDPVEQREKFTKQAENRKKGDEEAQPFDEDFLEAMEYGMPPMGGIGIGIDRITMLFTNQTSIKEVLFFPSMRPLKKLKGASKEVKGNNHLQ
ncbi:lysine--tRNA ligase [Candidatus Micrarchaeota archaeon]|nr:lysine--tRNA ligase [Candidatus Micrarchaeota archaeon]